MFWNQGQSSSYPPDNLEEPEAEQAIVLEPSASRTSSDDTELEALEALAAVLRSMGRHSFDLDDVPREESGEAFEKWALRLLIGDARAAGPEGPRTHAQGIRRDWGGVKRFTEQHRRAEHEYVVTGMANLRQAVRVFIQCTTGNFRAERQSEIIVCEDLDVLGRALAINDHAQIRAAAEKTAATLHHQMEERRSREQRQIDLLQDSMEKLRHELNQMRQAAKIDGLTKLFNRAALDEHIKLAADQSYLTGTESCVVMVDIDHFKGVNDNFGHQTGDEVLRQVAEELVRGFFRREDFVSRYGGEEFCIVAEHTTFDTTRERAERLRQAVENLAIVAFGKTLRVSVSFGIAALQHGETAASWLKRADEALYRAKLKGRNCISIAPPSEGEALGGRGAPLGATLSIRSPDGSLIIQRPTPRSSKDSSAPSSSPTVAQASPSSRPGARPRQPTRRSSNSSHLAAGANQNSEAPALGRKEGVKRKVGKTRPLGKPARKEPSAVKSPISALLGPTSRR